MFATVALTLALTVRAGTAEDEQAIKALDDAFAKALVNKDAKLRVSIWAEDGTLVPPQGGFLQAREAIAKHFATEIPAVTDATKVIFSNYRFRFIKRDAAFVDADITINNVIGPDGKLAAVVPVSVVFTAVRHGGKWLIQDERTHFAPMPPAV